MKIDDAVGAFPVHAGAGMIGTIAVGLFALEGGLFYGGGTSLLSAQLIGVIVVALWCISISYIIMMILKAIIGLRVSEKAELEGLDKHKHGIEAYSSINEVSN